MNKKAHGFTIVELLITIVVIAILAAISVVAYNGIQQRANNTAIINAASQSLKAIQAYIAMEGAYPYTAGTNSVCITADSGCVTEQNITVATNATFDTNMARISTLPRSVPSSGALGYGVMYHHFSGRRVNGQLQPAVLFYFLNGTSQNCGIGGVMDGWGQTPANSSATNWTTNLTGLNKTMCVVSIPGPSA